MTLNGTVAEVSLARQSQYENHSDCISFQMPVPYYLYDLFPREDVNATRGEETIGETRRRGLDLRQKMADFHFRPRFLHIVGAI